MTNLVATKPAADPLFELHPAPALLYRRGGEIVQANAAARLLLRGGAGRLAGANLAEFFSEVAMQLEEPAAPLCLRRVVVRRVDGSSFAARLQCVPAQCDGLTLASIEDLSEFEREVAAANREFEALTAAAGHDLRGPVRILKGFAEALDDECGEKLNEDGRNFLREILKASDRMEGLIDGLLAYSRAALAELARESLDLTTLVEIVFYELRHAQAEREVDCQVEPGLVAHGDVRLMMTVLRNLLGNAWKFTARSASASIRCHREQRAGREWICVTDDGVGFELGQATRLFKPFTRLHRQDQFSGHGLGLATAHRIVQRHGGEIAAESAPGRGTTVRFWLPRAD